MARKIISTIRRAHKSGLLPELFRSSDFRSACPGFSYATYSTFLPKHRQGNPDHNTELFEQIERGLYKLIH